MTVTLKGKVGKFGDFEKGSGGRIPDALKMIFVQAERGIEQNKPPEDGGAFKVFKVETPAPKPDKSEIRKSASSQRLDLEMERFQQDLKQSVPAATTAAPLADDTSVSEIDLASLAPPPMPTPSEASDSSKSPQTIVDMMLKSRGYSTDKFNTLETSYFNTPTELQEASYHRRLNAVVNSEKEHRIVELMTCGISLNPCNFHGESLLANSCRNGNVTAVRVMLECGASVQVSDDSGRTPLHACCAGLKPSLEIAEMLIQADRHLLMLQDRVGATPLAYLKPEVWGQWIDFFYKKRDEIWPQRNKRLNGIAPNSPKMTEKPNSCPLPDPEEALEVEMAKMVASGKLSTEEAKYLLEGGLDDSTMADDSSTYYDDGSTIYSDMDGSMAEFDDYESDSDYDDLLDELPIGLTGMPTF